MWKKPLVITILTGAIFVAITGAVVAAKDQAEPLRTRENSREVVVEDVQARLQVAVARADLTQEQADARLEVWRKAQADEKLAARQGKDLKTTGKRAGKKMTGGKLQAILDKAVAAGKITQAQVDEKLAARQGKDLKERGWRKPSNP